MIRPVPDRVAERFLAAPSTPSLKGGVEEVIPDFAHRASLVGLQCEVSGDESEVCIRVSLPRLASYDPAWGKVWDVMAGADGYFARRLRVWARAAGVRKPTVTSDLSPHGFEVRVSLLKD